jgi:DnaK suppressor protein
MTTSRRNEAILEIQARLTTRRELLDRRLATTEKYVIATTADQVLEGTFATHLADGASDMVTTEILVSDIDAITESIGQIDEALNRITSGSYGRCVDCGLDIDLARLKALPAAKRCVRCESRAELLADRERRIGK